MKDGEGVLVVRDGAVVDSVAGIPGIRAAATAAPRVRFVDPPASDLATTALDDDGYCMRVRSGHMAIPETPSL
jgi:hypothetical protein